MPGNHDHALLDDWLARRGRDDTPAPLGLESEVDRPRGSPGHGRGLAGAGPGPGRLPGRVAARRRLRDPRPLRRPAPDRADARAARRRGDGAGGRPHRRSPRGAEDYEAALAPIYAWIHALAQRTDPQRGSSLHGGSLRGWAALTGPRRRLGVRQQALALGYPLLVKGLNRAGIGPLRPELSMAALRRAGLRGIEEATTRLGVRAR